MAANSGWSTGSTTSMGCGARRLAAVSVVFLFVTALAAASGAAAPPPIAIVTGQDAGWPDVRGWDRYRRAGAADRAVGLQLDRVLAVLDLPERRAGGRRRRQRRRQGGDHHGAGQRRLHRAPRLRRHELQADRARSRCTRTGGGGTALSSPPATPTATAVPRSSTGSIPAVARRFTSSTGRWARRCRASGPGARTARPVREWPQRT